MHAFIRVFYHVSMFDVCGSLKRTRTPRRPALHPSSTNQRAGWRPALDVSVVLQQFDSAARPLCVIRAVTPSPLLCCDRAARRWDVKRSEGSGRCVVTEGRDRRVRFERCLQAQRESPTLGTTRRRRLFQSDSAQLFLFLGLQNQYFFFYIKNPVHVTQNNIYFRFC